MENGSIGQENPNLEELLNQDGAQDPDMAMPPSDEISHIKPMDAYIGTKIVLAQEMVEWEFLRLHKGMSKSEIDKRETQGNGYMVIYEDGYKSWSPQETFERAYRKITPQERKLI